MRHRDDSDIYRGTDQSDRVWHPDTGGLIDVLRSALHQSYSDVSDEQVADALSDVFDAMSPAEALNFASSLDRIGKSAGRLVSDPTFAAVAQTALPILGGAAGTLVGGPAGTALGSKLGSVAAGALPSRPKPAPAPAGAGSATVSAAAGGSTAAAQGLVLTQQPDVLRSLLATALGAHGQQTASGVPAAQVLGLLSQVFGRAAADADELMYLGRQPGAESVLDDGADDSADSLYADLLGADNLELAEAAGWDWPER